MSRFFTHYWLNRTWEWHREDGSEGYLLDHIAGNLFGQRGVCVGDTVYVVTVIEGGLYVCGKLIVGKVCNVDEAAATLRRSPEELWEAEEHIVAASATPMRFNLKVPSRLTRQLTFISGGIPKRPTFKSKDYLDGQTLRGVRELDPESAAALDSLLPPLKELRLDDESSVFPPLDEESFPEEVSGAHTYYEGATKSISVNVYERNAKARRACIAHYGTDCFICGFSFKAVYGEAGGGFIHVHHLKPLSEIGEEYRLDAIADLRPVCPNCHAMIHRRVPAYTIEEMKRLLSSSRR
jgi:hypothetical protein